MPVISSVGLPGLPLQAQAKFPCMVPLRQLTRVPQSQAQVSTLPDLSGSILTSLTMPQHPGPQPADGSASLTPGKTHMVRQGNTQERQAEGQ